MRTVLRPYETMVLKSLAPIHDAQWAWKSLLAFAWSPSDCTQLNSDRELQPHPLMMSSESQSSRMNNDPRLTPRILFLSFPYWPGRKRLRRSPAWCELCRLNKLTPYRDNRVLSSPGSHANTATKRGAMAKTQKYIPGRDAHHEYRRPGQRRQALRASERRRRD